MNPADRQELHGELAGQALERFSPADPSAPRQVNPATVTMVENVVRQLLDWAAVTIAPAAVAGTAAYKDQIRQLIGPAFLGMVDQMVHQLQDRPT